MKTTRLIFCIVIFTLLLTGLSLADIPKMINYQGKLTDTAGNPIEGARSITFNIYDQQAGGAPIWTETQTITIQRGIFTTQIGATKDLNLSFDRPYYLGIKIGSDAEMSPRSALSSSAYSFESQHANQATLAAAAVTLTDTTKLIPSGIIAMWSGSIANIPAGWVLCDGNNGTPDLRDRFIIGAGSKASVGSKGGRYGLQGSNNDLYILTSHHPGGWSNAPSGSEMCGGHSHNLMPPYYALAYIMKE